MVALAVTGFVVIGLWALMQSQNKTYTLQDNTSQMQQNLRAAVDSISRDLLSAGQVPQSTITGIAWYAAPNWYPYVVNLNGNNELDIVGCPANVASQLSTATSGVVAAGTTVLTLTAGQAAGWVNAGGGLLYQWACIGGAEVEQVAAVATGANTITLSSGLTNSYSAAYNNVATHTLSQRGPRVPGAMDHLPCGSYEKSDSTDEGSARRQRTDRDSL